MIIKDIKVKEDLIHYLEKLNFSYLEADDFIKTSHYCYKHTNYDIVIYFDTIGLGGGAFIELGMIENGRVLAHHFNDNAIDFLNKHFKYELRKLTIKKLLDE